MVIKFQGFVISDWEGIDRITSAPGANYTHPVLAGVNAGIDMVSISFHYRKSIAVVTIVLLKDQENIITIAC